MTPSSTGSDAPLPTPSAGARLASIDALRGLVMVLMALDHARIICAPQRFGWIHSLKHVEPAWFVTELLPHLCTPVFLFLAGVGTGLFEEKRGRSAAVRFLASRGLVLIALEVTVVHLGWHTFDWRPVYALQVIWAIGLSLLVFSVLIRLPRGLIAALVVLGIACTPLLPAIADAPGWAAIPLTILHQSAYLLRTESLQVAVTYPLLPWPFVLAAGYLAAPLFGKGGRRKVLVAAGIGLLLAFAALRFWNGSWADPDPWSPQARGTLFTVLSFFDVTKHPASPAFLAVTMGIALLLLAALDGARNPLSRWLAVIGRVPLFFYVLHLPLLQLLSTLGFRYPGAEGGWWMRGSRHWPEGYEPALWTAYLGLVVALALMTPACVAYGRLKARSSNPLWKYL